MIAGLFVMHCAAWWLAAASYWSECEVFKDILVKQRINYAIWILVYVLCCI